jgi:hypothetical protein
MYNRNAPPLIIALALLFSTEMTEGQNLFTGSQIKMDLAAAQAEVIFIGNVEKVEESPLLTPFGLLHYGVQIQVTDLLKGKVAPDVEVLVDVSVLTTPRETPPVVHQKYVFFGKNDKSGTETYIRILKLLPADDVAVAKVKQLIAAGSAPSPH